MVDWARLESVFAERQRGFESHPVRHSLCARWTWGEIVRIGAFSPQTLRSRCAEAQKGERAPSEIPPFQGHFLKKKKPQMNTDSHHSALSSWPKGGSSARATPEPMGVNPSAKSVPSVSIRGWSEWRRHAGDRKDRGKHHFPSSFLKVSLFSTAAMGWREAAGGGCAAFFAGQRRQSRFC